MSLAEGKVTISFDGSKFENIQEALSGEFTAGAGAGENGGVADAINLGLKARIRK